MELHICLYALLFFLLHFVTTLSSLTQHLCHRDESIALLQFKKMFNINPSNYISGRCNDLGQYSYPKISSWNKSRDCCTWDGVMCHKMTGYVISLDLSCSQLEGAISPNSSLFKLSQLEKLNLAFNDFNGSQISHGFGGFPRLMHFNLSSSNFDGQMASEISHLSKLVSLDFSDLSLMLPSDFQVRLGQHDFWLLLKNLTQISVLRLHGVDISSEIPSNLSSSLSYLDLFGTRIFGKIPRSIGRLKSLKVLNLGFCQISGSLPESIGNFSELIDLDLSGNKFTGQIPTAISNLGQLQQFNLERSKLEGQIPDFFTNLSKLSFLSLDGNNLIGRFPHSIMNLTELEYLDISHNSISGPLPSNVSGLQRLTDLNLGYNSLNGTLPYWLFHLPELKSLDLSLNQFTGQMDDFEENSPLEVISLGNNQLNGPIPESISILLNLTWLDFSANSLSGIIEPNMFSSLQKLEFLDLSRNSLQWRTENNDNISLPNLGYVDLSSCASKEFPNFLKSSKQLEYLMLSHNNIHQLPSWLTSMPWDSLYHLNLSHNSLSSLVPFPWKSLEVLDFRFNQIEGPLPLFVCKLEALELLDLSNNQFTGAIPQCFGNFSSDLMVLNLKNNRLQGKIALTFATKNLLVSLGLNGNILEGSLPRSLANCEQLEVLDVGNNNISDIFPTWLENLKELQVLILKSNRFFGPIGTLKTKNPFIHLRVIDISCNGFDGVLPIKLLNSFRAMMSVERNQSAARYIEIEEGSVYYQESMHMVMKGSEFEFTKILITLTSIDVSSNKFSGEIPKVIGNLVYMRYLNLSHNRFSGHIPSTLGNLSSLESLDISCNQIEGGIPWQLTSVPSLAFLNLSQNHLVGRIPQGQQFNTFTNDSYKGNLGLCGSPLIVTCQENKVPPPFPQSIPQQEEDSDFFSRFTWQSVILGYGCGFFLGVVVGTLLFMTRKPEKFVRFIEEEIYHCALFLSRKIHVQKNFKRQKRRGHKYRRVVQK